MFACCLLHPLHTFRMDAKHIGKTLWQIRRHLIAILHFHAQIHTTQLHSKCFAINRQNMPSFHLWWTGMWSFKVEASRSFLAIYLTNNVLWLLAVCFIRYVYFACLPFTYVKLFDSFLDIYLLFYIFFSNQFT